ncbi:TPA: hypothetical protein U8189_004235 [Pseudomonas aeruginosa]|nr:hypothetical protein [Pseudomonas aeruginosa]HEN8640978.1 hypothetical protein [Pseudomonas aeruginosa]HEN8671128.1 hypothetical protein [Pseudomonas aeruginosa]HEN8689035.1 hypothetical protein [Pseudomonas aeruginosa]HEN8819423.1 hypothetical protein [Pseudomonas aeruginosa]
MKLKLSLSLGLILSLSLIGCSEQQAPSDTIKQLHSLDLPALPILQGAILSLSKTLVPHRNPLVMEQLCAVARGDIQQENVNAFIQQQGGNAQSIPVQGHPLSLLVHGDRKTQLSACAAYLATSVLLPLNLTDLMVKTESPEEQEKNKKPEKSTPQVDRAKLLATLPNRLAIAQANADFFALIAADLQNRPGLTLVQYRQLSIEMFTRLAADYLQRIKEQMPVPGTEFKVLKLDTDQFVFVSSSQTLFAYDFSGLKLQQNGMTWFGEGKLLGKDYFLKVAYLPESAKQLTTIPTL